MKLSQSLNATLLRICVNVSSSFSSFYILAPNAILFIHGGSSAFAFSCPISFSAGAGRTGTFIALSNILERVKAEGLLDVFQTVKSLRTQRPHMVQTAVGGNAVQKLTAYPNL